MRELHGEAILCVPCVGPSLCLLPRVPCDDAVAWVTDGDRWVTWWVPRVASVMATGVIVAAVRSSVTIGFLTLNGSVLAAFLTSVTTAGLGLSGVMVAGTAPHSVSSGGGVLTSGPCTVSNEVPGVMQAMLLVPDWYDRWDRRCACFPGKHPTTKRTHGCRRVGRDWRCLEGTNLSVKQHKRLFQLVWHH